MKLAIYGDVHLTRNMRNLQEYWNESIVRLFHDLYYKFDSSHVESAICLGDFFDKSVLEARSVKLVTTVLNIMNSRTYPTYLLLGNHEIDSNERNILEYLEGYDNIIPITEKTLVDNQLLFVPYNYPIEELTSDELRGKFVFTHHDIYGSELASGKLKASFGVNPSIFDETIATYNGHVHTPSELGKVKNVGSLTKAQQGELKYLENPIYYITDTVEYWSVSYNIEENFIAYQDIDASQIKRVLDHYNESVKIVLRVSYDYEDEIEAIDTYRSNPRILKLTLRKNLKDSLKGESEVLKRKTLDVKEIITSYISKDSSLDETQKERRIKMSLEMIGACQ